VLSSFLLFYLALFEIEKTGLFSKKNFFIRRSLRIFPLYFFALFLGFIVVPMVANFFNHGIKPAEHPIYYLFFLSNYDFSDHLFALKFLWSIAVEEQFYLLFLLLSPLFYKKSWLVIVILLLAYSTYILISTQQQLPLFGTLPFHLINFVAGIVAAITFKNWNIPGRTYLVVFSALVIFSIVFTGHSVIFNMSSSFAFATLIILVIRASERFNLNQFKPFQWLEKLGSYSYGLYVYSGFAISFGTFFIHTGSAFFDAIIVLFITIAVSVVSYRYFESYFLRWKKRF
jgi:peptidoglycan/LPS O-acetylase OafA/YrhL